MNAEPFVGVRGFRLTSELTLGSLIMPLFWEQAEVGPAVCYARPTDGEIGKWQAARDPAIPEHEAPREGCRCGFGAYHPAALGQSVPNIESATVAAVVIGYGMVLPGTRGWRSSYARIMALILPDLITSPTMYLRPPPASAPADAIRAVAERYGVPAVRRSEVRELAPEFGQVLPWLPDEIGRMWK